MKKEVKMQELEAAASKAYNDFAYIWRVIREANVPYEEEKNLINKALEAANNAEEVFVNVENTIANIRDDEAIYVRQTIVEARKRIQEFKNVYARDVEPNA